MIRLSILAQTASAVESAMLDNDKLYVVLAVVLVIWVGIALFIFGTDRRIGRLERRIQTLESSPKT